MRKSCCSRSGQRRTTSLNASRDGRTVGQREFDRRRLRHVAQVGEPQDAHGHRGYASARISTGWRMRAALPFCRAPHSICSRQPALPTGDRRGARGVDRLHLPVEQPRRHLGLHQVVDAGRAAAAVRALELDDGRARQRAQELPRRAPHLLRVREVAGIVDRDRLVDRGARRRQSQFDQRLGHVAHARGERAGARGERLVVHAARVPQVVVLAQRRAAAGDVGGDEVERPLVLEPAQVDQRQPRARARAGRRARAASRSSPAPRESRRSRPPRAAGARPRDRSRGTCPA